jgi:hypothetical protein
MSDKTKNVALQNVITAAIGSPALAAGCYQVSAFHLSGPSGLVELGIHGIAGFFGLAAGANLLGKKPISALAALSLAVSTEVPAEMGRYDATHVFSDARGGCLDMVSKNVGMDLEPNHPERPIACSVFGVKIK